MLLGARCSHLSKEKHVKNNHPILFSSGMVRAIHAGRKTQTRRILKIGKSDLSNFVFSHLYTEPNNILQVSMKGEDGIVRVRSGPCPYGKPGDMLWVRETFAPSGDDENHEFARTGYTYRADWDGEDDAEMRTFDWKPAIHMPRKASRITLHITGVKVERLQDISEDDAKAEGVYAGVSTTFKAMFEALWHSINGEASWKVNPWVWVVEFEVINKNIDEVVA